MNSCYIPGEYGNINKKKLIYIAICIKHHSVFIIFTYDFPWQPQKKRVVFLAFFAFKKVSVSLVCWVTQQNLPPSLLYFLFHIRHNFSGLSDKAYTRRPFVLLTFRSFWDGLFRRMYLLIKHIELCTPHLKLCDSSSHFE